MENAAVCLNCGKYVTHVTKQKPNDSTSAGWWWLGFLFPFIGFILWLVWTDSTPIRAKKAGTGALTGIIVSVVLVVLFYILIFVLSFIVGMNFLTSLPFPRVLI